MASRLNRIRDLRRRLAVSTQARGEQLNLDHLQNLTEELRGLVDGLEKQTARCDILEIAVSAGDRNPVRRALGDLRSQLTTDPASVGQGTTFRNFKESVVELQRNLREEADTVWAERKSAAEAAVPESLLSFWETIPELQDDALAVRRHVGVVDRTARPIQDVERLEEFAKACEEIQERTERLHAFKAPPSVRAFLEAARSSSGADWTALTEGVRAWLEEHGLLDTLRIKLG